MYGRLRPVEKVELMLNFFPQTQAVHTQLTLLKFTPLKAGRKTTCQWKFTFTNKFNLIYSYYYKRGGLRYHPFCRTHKMAFS